MKILLKILVAPFALALSLLWHWTEANPLCIGFWQVKQLRAMMARSRGGLNGPPFSHGKEG